MDIVLGRRRELLLTQETVLDTSAKIMEYGVGWGRGKYLKESDPNYAITVFYDFPSSQTVQTLVFNRSMLAYYDRICMIQKNGQYYDWYGELGTVTDDISERSIFYGGCNQVSLTVWTANLENSWAYIKESGTILFAGKNTQYYGRKNISELN